MRKRSPNQQKKAETLRIRRPNARKPYGYDIRGRFDAIVRQNRFGLDTQFNLNLTDIFFYLSVIEALPQRVITDTQDPNYNRDVQKNDHLIRLKFYSDAETDTDLELKGIKRHVLQIISIEAYENAMLIQAKELGSL